MMQLEEGHHRSWQPRPKECPRFDELLPSLGKFAQPSCLRKQLLEAQMAMLLALPKAVLP